MKVATALVLLVSLPSFLASPRQAKDWPEGKRFPIYDNMFYKGKPDTAGAGLVGSNILYEGRIWPGKKNYGVLPDRKEFQSLVRKSIANPGPLVIDIEGLPLKGAAAGHNAEVLGTLADWARDAAPGKIIGYYGTNTLSNVPPANRVLARELATHVDAFFPPMYTFDDDVSAWEKRAEETAAEARSLDSHKPVYFYLWPQYHDGTPKAFQYLSADYWVTQLITSHRLADGVVLWSPSKFSWDDHTHWWRSTVEYARNIKPIPGSI